MFAQKQKGLNYIGVTVPVGNITPKQMTRLAEIADLYGSGEVRLTVWQNLMAILETRPMRHAERRRTADRLLTQYGLVRQKNQLASTLSGGERRKMEIARARVTDPALILLDEPFAGVDPIAKEELSREVRRLKDEFRKTVLITDHDVAFTLRVVDRALIIDTGRVQFEGTPREVINDAGVRSAYLGNTFRGDEFDDVRQVEDPEA